MKKKKMGSNKTVQEPKARVNTTAATDGIDQRKGYRKVATMPVISSPKLKK